jgi:hypothetical protein
VNRWLRRAAAVAVLVCLCAGTYAAVGALRRPGNAHQSAPPSAPAPRKLAFTHLPDVLPKPGGAERDDRRAQPVEIDLLAREGCAGLPFNGFLVEEYPGGYYAAMSEYSLRVGDHVAGNVHVNLYQVQYGRTGDAHNYLAGLKEGCAGRERNGSPYECRASRIVAAKGYRCTTHEIADGEPWTQFQVIAGSGRYVLEAFLSQPVGKPFPADDAALRSAFADWLRGCYAHVDRYLPTSFAGG